MLLATLREPGLFVSFYSLSTSVLFRLYMLAITGSSVTLFINASQSHKTARIILQVNKTAGKKQA